MDVGAWQATVHSVAESHDWVTEHTHTHRSGKPRGGPLLGFLRRDKARQIKQCGLAGASPFSGLWAAGTVLVPWLLAPGELGRGMLLPTGMYGSGLVHRAKQCSSLALCSKDPPAQGGASAPGRKVLSGVEN